MRCYIPTWYSSTGLLVEPSLHYGCLCVTVYREGNCGCFGRNLSQEQNRRESIHKEISGIKCQSSFHWPVQTAEASWLKMDSWNVITIEFVFLHVWPSNLISLNGWWWPLHDCSYTRPVGNPLFWLYICIIIQVIKTILWKSQSCRDGSGKRSTQTTMDSTTAPYIVTHNQI